jgi:hypothetical protein
MTTRYAPDVLEGALLDMLKLCLPDLVSPVMRIIFANQDGPRPAGTFLTLYVSGGVSVGSGEENMGDTADAGGLFPYTRRETRETSVSIQAFGPASWEVLQRLERRMFHPSLTWQIQALGLAPLPPVTLNRISVALGPQSEPRAAMTLTVRHLRDETVADRDIQRVSLTPTLDTTTFPEVIIDLTTP